MTAVRCRSCLPSQSQKPYVGCGRRTRAVRRCAVAPDTGPTSSHSMVAGRERTPKVPSHVAMRPASRAS